MYVDFTTTAQVYCDVATFDVTSADFDEKVLHNSLPVMVDFWATWCGPCKMAEPVLNELSDSYKDKVGIAKLNVDEHPAISQKYSVMSIPTTILFTAGQEIGRQVGFAGKNAFEDLIKKAL